MNFKLDNKTLSTIDRVLTGNLTTQNPSYRCWGGSVETLYETYWSKMNKAWDDAEPFKNNEKEYIKHARKANMYSSLMRMLLEKYPHLYTWREEMIGMGGLKVC